MTTAETNPFRAIQQRLDGGRLWQKRSLGDHADPNAPVCLRGAIYAVLGQRDSAEMAADAGGLEHLLLVTVHEQFPERRPMAKWDSLWHISITPFNDDPWTDWPDIDMVLDKTAAAWDESHPPR